MSYQKTNYIKRLELLNDKLLAPKSIRGNKRKFGSTSICTVGFNLTGDEVSIQISKEKIAYSIYGIR